MNFDFATSQRILFGPGTVRQLAPLAAGMGTRALLVIGLPEPLLERLLTEFTANALTYALFPVRGEPTVELVHRGVQFARQQGCDVIISVGGGSAIDTGKAIAGLLTNPGEVLDYLEVIGRAMPLQEPAAPFIAVPTTAGTGAEVTRNAVLGAPEQRVKVSLRSPHLLPRLALVDPELTYSLPPAITASTGLDALTQLIEPFVSAKANPLSDGFCREGLPRAARSLRRAYTAGHDAAAREDLSLASLLGGLALANAGLGAAHGFAGPLGGMYPAAHGALCAALLPFVMESNLHALQERQPQHPALARYDEIAQLLTAAPSARAADGIAWVRELCVALRIPPLSAYGVTAAHIPEIVAKSAKASSMKGNPVALTEEEMGEIIGKALV